MKQSCAECSHFEVCGIRSPMLIECDLFEQSRIVCGACASFSCNKDQCWCKDPRGLDLVTPLTYCPYANRF